MSHELHCRKLRVVILAWRRAAIASLAKKASVRRAVSHLVQSTAARAFDYWRSNAQICAAERRAQQA